MLSSAISLRIMTKQVSSRLVQYHHILPYHYTISKMAIELHSFSSITTSTHESTSAKIKTNRILYLHVSPDGDFWTGDELFAAKHLEPNYVRSVALPEYLSDKNDNDNTETCIKEIFDFNELEKLMREVYDTESLPSQFLARLQCLESQVEEN